MTEHLGRDLRRAFLRLSASDTPIKRRNARREMRSLLKRAWRCVSHSRERLLLFRDCALGTALYLPVTDENQTRDDEGTQLFARQR
jgi:hypothetical protein